MNSDQVSHQLSIWFSEIQPNCGTHEIHNDLWNLTRGSCPIRTYGHHDQNGRFFFTSKFGIGSFLVEYFAIFQLCFMWLAWRFVMVCLRLHSRFFNLKILIMIPLMIIFRFSSQQLSKFSKLIETKICCGILFYPTIGVFFTLGSCGWSKGKLQYNSSFGNNHYWMHFDFTPLGFLFFGLPDSFDNIMPCSCFKSSQKWFFFERGKVYYLQHAVFLYGCDRFHSRLYKYTRKTYNYIRNVCNHCSGICISWLQFCPKMLQNLQK